MSSYKKKTSPLLVLAIIGALGVIGTMLYQHFFGSKNGEGEDGEESEKGSSSSSKSAGGSSGGGSSSGRGGSSGDDSSDSEDENNSGSSSDGGNGGIQEPTIDEVKTDKDGYLDTSIDNHAVIKGKGKKHPKHPNKPHKKPHVKIPKIHIPKKKHVSHGGHKQTGGKGKHKKKHFGFYDGGTRMRHFFG